MEDSQEDFICISREPLSQDAFDKLYRKPSSKHPFKERIQEKIHNTGVWKVFSSFVPLLRVIRYYNIRRDFVGDIISGVTCSLFHIPNALAFSLLANVGIKNGLYTAVWPVMLYAIFGTSTHVSMGTSAIICTYTGSVIDRQMKYFKVLPLQNNSNTSSYSQNLIEADIFRENVAASVSLLTGLFLVILGILKASFLSHILSEAFMSAFSTAAAIHIIIRQLPTILGLTIDHHAGIFKLGYIVAGVFEKLSSLNGLTLLISVLAIVILFVFKITIDKRFKSLLLIPFPVELFVVIIGIIVTSATNLEKEVELVGPISKTIRRPSVPDLSRSSSYILDSLILAIFIYQGNVAVSRVYAKRHSYVVDVNQEFFAYGFCNFIGAFLHCIPSSVSNARSSVNSSLNARTTVCGFVSAVLMLLAVAVSPYVFQYLPKSTLSAILVVSAMSMMLQILDVKRFWRVNKFEYLVWLFTFICTVFLDLNYGFLIGFGFSVILVIVETQFVHGFKLNKTVEEKVYVQNKKYKNTMETAGIKIFRFHSNVYFANAEIFKLKLYRKTVNPRKLLKYIKKQEKKLAKMEKLEEKEVPVGTESKRISITGDIPPISIDFQAAKSYGRQDSLASSASSIMTTLTNYTNESEEEDPDDGQTYISMRKYEIQKKVHHVILDFSPVNYIDYTGANMLIQIISEYGNVNIKVFLANCSADVLKTMEKANVFNSIPKSDIFIDVYDAVATAIEHDRSNVMLTIERELSLPSDDPSF